MQQFYTVWLLTTLISREKLRKIQFSIFEEKFVKIQQFCTVWLFTTLISREKLRKIQLLTLRGDRRGRTSHKA